MYLSPFPLTYLLFLSNYFVNSSLISFVLIDRYWKKIPAPNSHVIIWPSGHVAVGSIHACAPTSTHSTRIPPTHHPRSNHAQVVHAQYPVQAFYGLSEPRYPHSDPITHAQPRSWLPALLWKVEILRSPRYDQPVQGCRTSMV
jgi:hypothetical protein